MEVNLETTNLLLGIMAAVSVLQALLIIGLAVAGLKAYRRVMTAVDGIEQRQMAPSVARLNAILDDIKSVSATIKRETDRMDDAIQATIGRVDDSVDRMQSSVRAKTSRLVGLVRGVRVAIEAMLSSRAA